MKLKLIWDIPDLVRIAKGRQEKELDLLIAFCGPRGSSKSTAAYRMGLGMENFVPEKDLIYDRDELLKQIESFEKFMIADEIINAAYKREFYNLDQIELVKLLNMYRDHRNIMCLCIPNFWDLDKPLRDLVKIRIDMIRRGFGVVHVAKTLSYSNDPWDKSVNEKVEAKWSRRTGVMTPKYSQLSTFAGYLKFKKLTGKQEERYKEIKQTKREELRAIRDAAKRKEYENSKEFKDAEKKKMLYSNLAIQINKGYITRRDIDKIMLMQSMERKKFMDNLKIAWQDQKLPLEEWQMFIRSPKNKNLIHQRVVLKNNNTEGGDLEFT